MNESNLNNNQNDEINLFDIINVIIKHKKKYLIGLVGLTLGLIFTYTHQPLYSTLFKITVAHPVMKTEIFLKSANMQSMLNDYQLNEGKLPNFSLHKKSQIFTVMSKNNNVKSLVESKITEILRKELIQLRESAKYMSQNNITFVNKNTNNATIFFSNEDYSTLDIDNVLQSIKINYSQTRYLYPNPIKHGIIGLFIGLFLAFIWMLMSIVFNKIK